MLSKGALLRSARGEDWGFGRLSIKVGRYKEDHPEKSDIYYGYIGPEGVGLLGTPYLAITPGELVEYSTQGAANNVSHTYDYTATKGTLILSDLRMWPKNGIAWDAENYLFFSGLVKNGEIVAAALSAPNKIELTQGSWLGEIIYKDKGTVFSDSDVGKVYTAELVSCRIPIPEFSGEIKIGVSGGRYGAGVGFSGELRPSKPVFCGGVETTLKSWGVVQNGDFEQCAATFVGYSVSNQRSNAPTIVLKDKGVFAPAWLSGHERFYVNNDSTTPTKGNTWEGQTIPYALIGSDEVVTKLYEAYEKGKRAFGGGVNPYSFSLGKANVKALGLLRGFCVRFSFRENKNAYRRFDLRIEKLRPQNLQRKL